jgi:RHS repeat-associated protein
VWLWHQGEPFGNNLPDENPSGLGTFELTLRFTGQRYDAETGLHYNYFRDYDPSTGRYGESDPIGLKGGLNTYAYVNGQPIKLVDPRGLFAGDGHPIMTEEALAGDDCFPGLPMEVQDVDTLSGSQRPENARWHCMSNGTTSQSASDAEQAYNSYVAQQVATCSLKGLARALHATQDCVASGHQGFQPWHGGLPSAGPPKG